MGALRRLCPAWTAARLRKCPDAPTAWCTGAQMREEGKGAGEGGVAQRSARAGRVLEGTLRPRELGGARVHPQGSAGRMEG